MIRMNDVTKIYQSKNRLRLFRSETRLHTAVHALNLSIEPGEVAGLLGLNGAGKTTTIRMLSTLLDPTSGTIEVDGLSMNTHRRMIQQKVNMIPGGERMLYWRLTGRENLEYFGRLYGLSRAAINSESARLLNEVGLADAADLPVEQYSKGMKQRLQIARGLINDPAYLFLDEPTLGLDAPIARQLRATVSRLAKEQGKGILLTSHYLQEVEELCDRVYILNRGELLLCGKPEAIISQIAGSQTAHLDVNGWDEQLRPLLLTHLSGLGYPAQLAGTAAVSGQTSAQEDESYRISVQTPAADRLITTLLPWASSHGLRIHSFSCDKPTLEDAIIRLAEDKVS
ncbi:ABC transporter ATP-binding protein [Paenibacillus sp. MMS20-IR301]|uniref:ABC transporter ATP-binding protein n=1 Tax=Paenibacillus sp. MMS20-IR301 TaxID=2895946 RepID=UPI0028EA24A9|nr:ABC transporter ATP-binding protein [Paenibacillus sp. MMS20-IR301]WNS44930.1 ABC transporter ATP-binding protein [Paenibacillus sp. MMS20-IR301]